MAMVKVVRKMELKVDGRRDSRVGVSNLVGGLGGTSRVQLACALPPPAGERASPEQAAPGTEDNAETPAGAEVTPCMPACLSISPLPSPSGARRKQGWRGWGGGGEGLCGVVVRALRPAGRCTPFEWSAANRAQALTRLNFKHCFTVRL